MSQPDQYPSDLLYHPEHDWVRIDGDTATFGVTDFAQEQLGEIVFWDGPAVGAKVEKDEPYAELESVKAVSDVIAPLSGTVVEANDRLTDEPGLINQSPHGEAWLVRVRIANPSEREALLDAGSYKELIA